MNERIQISNNFYLDEYVTKEMYMKWGRKCIWWIRPEVIKIDQFLRTRFNTPIQINNWWFGGSKDQRGLRYPNCTIGAKDSFHKFGGASDKIFLGKPNDFYKEVQADIMENFGLLYAPLGLTTIEDHSCTPDWLHTDCRNTGMLNLFIMKP